MRGGKNLLLLRWCPLLLYSVMIIIDNIRRATTCGMFRAWWPRKIWKTTRRNIQEYDGSPGVVLMDTWWATWPQLFLHLLGLALFYCALNNRHTHMCVCVRSHNNEIDAQPKIFKMFHLDHILLQFECCFFLFPKRRCECSLRVVVLPGEIKYHAATTTALSPIDSHN